MAHTQTLRTLALKSHRRYLPDVIDLFRFWSERARTRRQLSNLEDHRLLDIGVTREQAMAEAHKSFWCA